MNRFLYIVWIVLACFIKELDLTGTIDPDCNEDISEVICLDYNYISIRCNRSNECAFKFYCPEDFFVVSQTGCHKLHEMDVCPNISTLSYSIELNEDYVIPSTNSTPIESSFIPNTVCAFSVTEFLSSGVQVPIFELQFDSANGKMSLNADFQLHEDDIECYGRDYQRMLPIPIKSSPGKRDKDIFYKKYLLEIPEEPFIYFCVIASPMTFALKKSNEIVGYSNTTGDKYIAKIIVPNRMVPAVQFMLFQMCNSERFKQCKIIDRRDEVVYYYFRDFQRNNFSYIEEIFEGIIGRFQFSLEYLKNIEYCLPDTTFNGIELTWNTTLIGRVSTPTELCFDHQKNKVTRRCEGDFFSGAYWGEPSGNCIQKRTTGTFQLQFDRVNGKLSLITNLEFSEYYIVCSRRDYRNNFYIPIKIHLTTSENQKFYKKYLLEISEEPYIYFCKISWWFRTDEVIGYCNTSGEKYIAKIIVTNGMVPITDMESMLLQMCNSERFKQCKIIDKRDEVVYYYLQDFQRNNFRYIEEIFDGITDNFEFCYLEYLRNIEYCLPDITFNGIELTWNTILIGTATTPAELCLDDEGNQVTRRCEGDFFSGAYWSRPSKNCSSKFEIPRRTLTPVFQLQFDTANEKMSLTTGFQLSQNDIECYRRDYQRMLPIPIKDFPGNRSNRVFYKKYLLEIREEPYIYFCTVSSQITYPLNKTDEIIAYFSTSGNKYIAKIIVSNGTVPITDMELMLFEKCNSERFQQCKVIDRRDEVVYYYIQDFRRNNFNYIEEIFDGITGRFQFRLEYLKNIEYCLPDITFNGTELSWNTTLIGTATTPSELCLDDEGNQVTRRCEGDFFSGAYWAEPSENCSQTFKIPERTSRLHRLIEEDSIVDIFPEISAETDDFNEFTPVDVNLFSVGLKGISMISNASSFKDDFFHSVSNLMRINSSILRSSQEQLNSTDTILDSIETFVSNTAEDVKNLSVMIESNLLTQISYPFQSNVVGLAIHRNGEDGFSGYQISSLHWDKTFEDLNLDKLELAVFIPSEYLRNLTRDFTDEEKADFKIINTIFYNDGLFNDLVNENRSAGSRVINVDIPILVDTSQVPIKLLFRKVLNFTDSDCAFWDYGRQRLGEWSTTGGQYLGKYQNETLIECNFDHITHFSLLVLRENLIQVWSSNDVIAAINPLEAHKLALTLITLIGCGLSWMGIVLIISSALLFKEWYKKRLNTIQLGIVMLLEIIIMYVADLESLKGESACTAIAASLHYIVLSKFVWMLIIARIQYLKFVKVFDSLQVKSHIIIHMLIGWISPIIPVVVALLIFPDNFKSGNLHFCYPTDFALYFFILLPISVIILINIAIFVAIMITVSRSKAQDYGVDMQQIQIRLAVMLFFMLGITWMFGVIGEFLPWSWFKLVCIYIFCILGSIQGCVLCVFTVTLDGDTRELWNKLCIPTPKRDMPYETPTRREVIKFDGENVTVNYFGKED